MDVLIRSGLALMILVGGLGLYRLYNWMLKRRSGRLLADLGPVRRGAVVLLYFTTPHCVPCKTVQRPAIRRVQEMLGESLQVIEIDASEQPDLAGRWGVLSVPTTFLIDGRGKLRHVNPGVTSAEKLLGQFQATA